MNVLEIGKYAGKHHAAKRQVNSAQRQSEATPWDKGIIVKSAR
jgi:hypothetical protein